MEADGPPPSTRRLVSWTPDSVQTEIRVGQLAIPRKHPDYLAWDWPDDPWRRRFDRLQSRAASERGLTYARPLIPGDEAAGDFACGDQYPSETTGRSAAAHGGRFRSCLGSGCPSGSCPMQGVLIGRFP